MEWKFHLPVTFSSNRNIGVVSLVVIRVCPTKHDFTTLLIISVSIEPEREDRFLHQALGDHVIPTQEAIGVQAIAFHNAFKTMKIKKKKNERDVAYV